MLERPAGKPAGPSRTLTSGRGRLGKPLRSRLPDAVSVTAEPVDLTGEAMTRPIMPSHVPATATPEGDGVVVGDGPVRIDAFIDFLCPFCRRFELASEPPCPPWWPASGPALSTTR